MDTSTIIIIVLVLAAIAYFVFRRGRPAPRGTYDDPKVRSSGSIGGGPRAHDDPKVRSGGSIGGGPRTYDAPETRSEGSIGNQSTASRTARPDPERSTRPDPERSGADRIAARRSAAAIENNEDGFEDENDPTDPTYNDRKLKSGGSFGSS
jgi:hypothetical protein